MLYLLKRLGFYLIAAFAALTLNFFLPRLMPGDPATALFARFRGRLGPEALEALRETFG
ncbi:MAG: ABC transporter permease, partial [Candidatus Eisenbacteria bacterium]|nr:ABC transporter permease [Candidatus Eisenbacteria bacterium]